MAINRTTIRRLEREAQAETLALMCSECGKELWVEPDTDLAYIAWCWTQETGAEAYRPTHPDVFIIANHPHEADELIVKCTGENWLARLENAGGHRGDHGN
jgi:hypothetical protein